MNSRVQRKVFVIALAVVMMLILSACGPSRAALEGLAGLSDSQGTASSAADGDLEAQLIGYWSEVDIDNTYTFNSDGTGEERFESTTWEMTWSLDGDTLTMDFPATGVEEYRISIKGDTLKVYNTPLTYEYIRQ